MTSLSLSPHPNQNVCPLTTSFEGGELSIGGRTAASLASEFSTPLWVIDRVTLRSACEEMARELRAHYPAGSGTTVLFAAKSWPLVAVLATARLAGLEVDVASAGEMEAARAAGFAGRQMWFHGNNKSSEELAHAVEVGARVIVDNFWELETLVAAASQRPASLGPIEVLVRVCPGIEAHTHEYIRTGQYDSKFGFPDSELPRLFARLKECVDTVKCIGVHAHVGSQVTDMTPYTELPAVMTGFFVAGLRAGLPFTHLNVGGGLGTRYLPTDPVPPSIAEWARTVAEGTHKAAQAAGLSTLPHLMVEAGRCLVSASTTTLYTVGAIKHTPGLKTFVSVDGGLSDNPRPILYRAAYQAVVANRDLALPGASVFASAPAGTQTLPQTPGAGSEPVQICGKHCESGDVLIRDARLNTMPKSGDTLAVFCTGAYNAAMSSQYNKVCRPAAVLVENGKAMVVLKRETFADLISHDITLDDLTKHAPWA
jgi:diaminopimelate decarboxylase